MILPTLNERENIVVLIEQIVCSNILPKATKVIVVDDGSTDGTRESLESLSHRHQNLRVLHRDEKKNLPSAIYYGVKASSTEYVAWMDADLSMPLEALERMWRKVQQGIPVVIGSRFISGGGFKGIDFSSRNSLGQLRKNLKDTRESFMAVVLSRAFNYGLRLLSFSEVLDVTSGFIIIRRKLVKAEWFNCQYGEYFLNVVNAISNGPLKFVEVPYVNLPRAFGHSKTGSTLFELVSRGIPYIKLSMRLYLKRTLRKVSSSA